MPSSEIDRVKAAMRNVDVALDTLKKRIDELPNSGVTSAELREIVEKLERLAEKAT